jgi:hypothetical protein
MLARNWPRLPGERVSLLPATGKHGGLPLPTIRGQLGVAPTRRRANALQESSGLADDRNRAPLIRTG